jgi:hypothetical protein
LFLLYINDLHEQANNVTCSLFADDAKLYVSVDRDTATDDNLAQSLEAIHRWSALWQLSLSIPKCVAFCFGRGRVPLAYSVGGMALECNADVVDLGVTLSGDAKTSSHCSQKSKKALQAVNHIFRSFRTRNHSFLLKMFQTYVRPIVDYNSPIWSPYLLKDIKTVERVQRKFTKRFPGLHGYSYAERMRILKLETVEQNRPKTDLILAFRMHKGLVELNFEDFFELAPDVGTRGHRAKLLIQHNRLESTKFSFSHRVAPAWNALPDSVVTSTSLAVFKSRLKNIDLSVHCVSARRT